MYDTIRFINAQLLFAKPFRPPKSWGAMKRDRSKGVLLVERDLLPVHNTQKRRFFSASLSFATIEKFKRKELGYGSYSENFYFLDNASKIETFFCLMHMELLC